MTRRIDEFERPISDEQYSTRHQDRPKSLAEQDAEWARRERIQAAKAERARKRVKA
ncbi:hypothetical protein [Rhodococcus sp. 1168]|uniref:hypothetical protein n=1 Tax=Rhodococcus sp. 1168 TaxID=2018041 RepID=UPI001593CE24|nr:hypothetical protein [Rhodococcus sp. 1168]